MDNKLISKCHVLIDAYKSGKLGQSIMPEESNPGFEGCNSEKRLAYFTLPMSLNYQRDSYKLWEAALNTYNDPKTKDVFSVKISAGMTLDELRTKLTKHKLALQPNKHIHTWKTISSTIFNNYQTLTNLFKQVDYDFLKLKLIVQVDNKRGFPYLSGPKIFNYWSFIISEYGQVPLKNTEYIDIAPDTHITKCSVLLGVISETEVSTISKEEISQRWRNVLKDSGINPIQMHPPLWFWSRNNFIYKLE